jgi:hypothetical protein
MCGVAAADPWLPVAGLGRHPRSKSGPTTMGDWFVLYDPTSTKTSCANRCSWAAMGMTVRSELQRASDVFHEEHEVQVVGGA